MGGLNLGSMVATGLAGGSSLFSVMGEQSANQQNTALTHQGWNVSSNEARIQRDWEEKMSNTAYQRATDDMKKAGINPMVAFQQGGASTPSGASASIASPNRVNNIMGGLSTSAMDAMRLGNEVAATGSQMKYNDAAATKALAEASTSGYSAKEMSARTKTIEAQLDAIRKEAKVRSQKAGYDSSAVGYDAVMSRLNREAGTAHKVLNSIPRGPKPRGEYLDGDGAVQQFP